MLEKRDSYLKYNDDNLLYCHCYFLSSSPNAGTSDPGRKYEHRLQGTLCNMCSQEDELCATCVALEEDEPQPPVARGAWPDAQIKYLASVDLQTLARDLHVEHALEHCRRPNQDMARCEDKRHSFGRFEICLCTMMAGGNKNLGCGKQDIV